MAEPSPLGGPSGLAATDSWEHYRSGFAGPPADTGWTGLGLPAAPCGSPWLPVAPCNSGLAGPPFLPIRLNSLLSTRLWLAGGGDSGLRWWRNPRNSDTGASESLGRWGIAATTADGSWDRSRGCNVRVPRMAMGAIWGCLVERTTCSSQGSICDSLSSTLCCGNSELCS